MFLLWLEWSIIRIYLCSDLTPPPFPFLRFPPSISTNTKISNERDCKTKTRKIIDGNLHLVSVAPVMIMKLYFTCFLEHVVMYYDISSPWH